MKNLKLIALSLTGALVMAACQQPTPTTPVTPTNVAPTAIFSPSTTSGSLVVNVTDASTDPQGIVDIASYSWDWGDGTAASTGKTPGAHTYATAKNYTITLTVTDKGGLSNSTTRTVDLSGGVVVPPSPTATDVDLMLVASGAGLQPTDTLANIVISAAASKKAGVQGTLTKLTLSGTGVTAVSYDLTASMFSGTLPVTVPGSGAFSGLVTVTVTDSNGNTKTTQVLVTRAATPVVPPTPNASGNTEFSFGGTGATPSATYDIGIMESDDSKYYTQARVPVKVDGSDPQNVVRYVAQGIESATGFATYAKGKVKFSINPRTARAGVAVDHVDYKLVRTPGGPAIDYIDDNNSVATNFTSFPYDTAAHLDLEGRLLYVEAVVTWVDGFQAAYSRPLIVDRTAPQAPDVEVKGAPVNEYTNSNTTPVPGFTEAIWARGTVFNFISNADLRDLPVKPSETPVTPAPGTGTPVLGANGEISPVGLEAIAYYYVPAVPVFTEFFVCKINAAGTTALFPAACNGPAAPGGVTVYPQQVFVISPVPGTGGSTVLPLKQSIITGFTLPSAVDVAVGDAARATAIRKNAINVEANGANLRGFLNSESRGAVANQPYRTSVGSGFDNAAYPAPLDYTSKPVGANPAQNYTLKAAQDNAYFVFAVSRDRLGNSRPSTSYKVVLFDNVGPKLVGGGISDVSPLPFPAQTGYLSDHGRFGGSTLNDVTGNSSFSGVGLPAGGGATVSFGGFNFPIFAVIQGQISVTAPAIDFDSNLISDGKYSLSLGSLGGSTGTDILGNPPTASAITGEITVDNTDPTVQWTSPAEGQVFNAFETVNIQTNPSDQTAGLFATSLFWNDFIPNNLPGFPGGVGFPLDRTRANGFVGGPVEISRGLAAYDNTNDGGIANGSNARWHALFPGYSGQQLSAVESMALNSLAVDKAGNATLGRRLVRVNKPTTISSIIEPSIGNFDVHTVGIVPSFHEITQSRRGIAPVLNNGTNNGIVNGGGLNTVETILNERFSQWTAETKVGGTFARWTGTPPQPLVGPATNSTVPTVSQEGVNFYRQFGTANWARIKLWQVATDPSINRTAALKTERYTNWLIADQDAANFAGIVANYYPNAGGTPTLSDYELVARSIDETYAAGNFFGVNTASTAPWMKFDNTVTSNDVHKVTSNFQSNYNAPVVTASGGLYQFNNNSIDTFPFGVGNVRLYSPTILNPSTTAIANVVNDNAGLYNYTFEALGATYGLTGALTRIDGVATNDQ